MPDKWRRVWYRGGWYAARTENGQTKRFSLRTKDRQDADRQLADINKKPVGKTVAEIFQAYCVDLEQQGKPRERADYAWRALQGAFGHLRPDQVSRSLCRAYATQRRRQGRQNGTVAKELDILRSALYWGDKRTPAEIEAPKRPPPRDRYLTRAEYRQLLRAAKDVGLHIYLFVVLALATAGRKTALLELEWDRVDFGLEQIRLATDGTGKGRATVPMTDRARRVLRVAKRYAVSDHVIEYAGRPVGSIKRGFASAVQRAGLSDVTPHVLRHTAAVWMAEDGVPMPEIAQYLGHSDDRITQRVYARYSPGYLKKAARSLR